MRTSMHPIDYSYSHCLHNCWMAQDDRDSKLFVGSAQIVLGAFLQGIGALITISVVATVVLMAVFFPIAGLTLGIALGLVQARIGVALFEWGVEIEKRGEKLLHQYDRALQLRREVEDGK